MQDDYRIDRQKTAGGPWEQMTSDPDLGKLQDRFNREREKKRNEGAIKLVQPTDKGDKQIAFHVYVPSTDEAVRKIIAEKASTQWGKVTLHDSRRFMDSNIWYVFIELRAPQPFYVGRYSVGEGSFEHMTGYDLKDDALGEFNRLVPINPMSALHRVFKVGDNYGLYREVQQGLPFDHKHGNGRFALVVEGDGSTECSQRLWKMAGAANSDQAIPFPKRGTIEWNNLKDCEQCHGLGSFMNSTNARYDCGKCLGHGKLLQPRPKLPATSTPAPTPVVAQRAGELPLNVRQAMKRDSVVIEWRSKKPHKTRWLYVEASVTWFEVHSAEGGWIAKLLAEGWKEGPSPSDLDGRRTRSYGKDGTDLFNGWTESEAALNVATAEDVLQRAGFTTMKWHKMRLEEML